MTLKLFLINILIIESHASLKQARIVGGQGVRGNIPYQVSLQYKIENRGFFSIQLPFMPAKEPWEHICGGSIISPIHVLTAAHCVVDFKKEMLSVVVGTLKRTEGGSRHLIDWIVTHPNYKELVTSDIGIIKIENRFKFADNIQPIAVEDTFIGGGTTVRLTGWGYAFPIRMGDLPGDLQIVKMKTMTNEDCNSEGHNVTPTELCAFRSFLKGACGGDSGGPLTNTAGLKQYGIVSYGTLFCAIGAPDVFTRVSVFIPWILNLTQGLAGIQTSTTVVSTESTSAMPDTTSTMSSSDQTSQMDGSDSQAPLPASDSSMTTSLDSTFSVTAAYSTLITSTILATSSESALTTFSDSKILATSSESALTTFSDSILLTTSSESALTTFSDSILLTTSLESTSETAYSEPSPLMDSIDSTSPMPSTDPVIEMSSDGSDLSSTVITEESTNFEGLKKDNNGDFKPEDITTKANDIENGENQIDSTENNY